MTITKQTNIKNRTYYFYNDLIKLSYFYPDMLKLNKKTFKGIDIHFIGYVTKKEEYKINIVNPLYLLICKIDGFIEQKRRNKYLNIAFTENNDKILENHKEVLSGIKSCIKKINNTKSGEYEKDYMEIRFNFDYKLPLSKQLKLISVTIVIRSVYEEDGKYYP